MNDLPARNKPPHNVNVLGGWLTKSANHSGMAVERLRRWLGFMVVAAMLDQARRDDGDWPAVRVACVEVFESRAFHPWPPTWAVPDDWADGYRALAIDTRWPVPTSG